jgi:hypothetical protein
MSRVFIYVVDRDLGFAPNPFHGVCSLATCKPLIRKKAQVGDWVIGVGGRRLNATGKCIYAMEVSQTLSFNEYWLAAEFRDKRPVRNGTRVMMVGDNIYHRRAGNDEWHQLDSHHSLAAGVPNLLNVKKDTSVDRVLLSRKFYYFGASARLIPSGLLERLGFQNRQGHRIFDSQQCAMLLEWVRSHRNEANIVVADPFNFNEVAKRYSGKGSALV